MNIKRVSAIAAIAGASALVLAACSTGGGNSGSTSGPDTAVNSSAVVGPKIDSSLGGTITAGGSSAQANAQTAWAAAFQAQASGITVNYDKSQGSGGGVTNWLNGSYDFAGSDAALNPTQFAQAKTLCAGGDPVDLPAYLSGVAVIYNLPGVKLQLRSATVAKIFTRQITSWGDPAIAADNPGAALPAGPITVVTRSDGSGTTANFTTYLHDTQPSIFTQAPGTAWPVPGTSGQQGGSGVVTAVAAGEGTIGYADQSSINGATAARIQVGTGTDFVGYTAAGATAAFEAGATVHSQGTGDMSEVIDYSKITDASAYPIPLLSYVITCTAHKEATQGELTRAYLGFVLSTLGQQVGAKNAGAAPLPNSVLKQAQKTIATIK
ncbi:phosphate ABC transporter substrate-binding protein PstS [Pseudolysinimonas kribbensis]|uniref:Phosphate-binding protein n=1 Tax=Pseudolysinimonas kribbensis TaxID=433641 RepID=A0ABQ6K5C6_9MICO|nr:substrate-binding domain-containing protein [Pseudolysinimonas kribbensis]GMA95817.1 phosphate-binding protein PstS [Pseudolysinimonas kribbensis]